MGGPFFWFSGSLFNPFPLLFPAPIRGSRRPLGEDYSWTLRYRVRQQEDGIDTERFLGKRESLASDFWRLREEIFTKRGIFLKDFHQMFDSSRVEISGFFPKQKESAKSRLQALATRLDQTPATGAAAIRFAGGGVDSGRSLMKN